jgi:hypothetical protein
MENKLIPNSTQVPNIITDFIIPQLPEAEARCLLYICRRTFGFHKSEDRISFTQFMEGIKAKDGKILDKGAGLARGSVNEALKNLIKSEAIFVRRDSKGNYYQINLEMDADKVVQQIDWFRKQTRSGIANRPRQVRLLNLQKKEKKRETKSIADKSAHARFIEYFYNTAQKARGIKLIINGKDGKNLKRVLELNILTENELQQLALYFLASPYYKKFSPSIATFLSAGILNGLINDLRNKEDFWKELNNFSYARDEKPSIQIDNSNCESIAVRLAELRAKLIADKVLT